MQSSVLAGIKDKIQRDFSIDEETGACYDGLNENGLNLNQGSECLVSYGIAFMELSNHIKI